VFVGSGGGGGRRWGRLVDFMAVVAAGEQKAGGGEGAEGAEAGMGSSAHGWHEDRHSSLSSIGAGMEGVNAGYAGLCRSGYLEGLDEGGAGVVR